MASFKLIEEITSKEPEFQKTNCFDIQGKDTESIVEKVFNIYNTHKNHFKNNKSLTPIENSNLFVVNYTVLCIDPILKDRRFTLWMDSYQISSEQLYKCTEHLDIETPEEPILDDFKNWIENVKPELKKPNPNLICVFDVETTGLPDPVTRYKASAMNHHLWPYMLQLAYVIVDTDKCHVLDRFSYLVRIPDEIIIPEESSKVHGITKEQCNERGNDIRMILETFLTILEHHNVSKIIAHNIDFDINMVKAECYRLIEKQEKFALKNRLGEPIKNYAYTYFNKLYTCFNTRLNNVKKFCTMKNNKDRCGIVRYWDDGTKYNKFPSLIELYQYLFNETPSDLHDAMMDVFVCLKCYVKTECVGEKQKELITDCEELISRRSYDLKNCSIYQKN